jgi:acyl carrier protein
LPSYMAPSTYLPVDKFPTTANGKLDDDALVKLLEAKRSAVVHTEPAAVESIEARVRSIWSRILDTEEFGDHDEFFDLGGTSFSLIQMLTLVNEQFKTKLRIDIFGEGASVAALVNALQQYRAKTTPAANAQSIQERA